MYKRCKKAIQVVFFIGPLLIVVGIIILLELIPIITINFVKNIGFLIVGMGLLCTVPKLYFSVKNDEQEKYNIDFVGRKTYVVITIIAILLIAVSIF
jgi:hypothetical protein